MADFGRVVVLGCGYAGTAVARLARERGHDVLAHVRSEARAAALHAAGFAVHQRAVLDESIGEHLDARTLVVVAFPPDGVTDARIAPALAGSAGVTYISSTGVYGEHRGAVDDTTPVPSSPPPNARAALTLAAEHEYRL